MAFGLPVCSNSVFESLLLFGIIEMAAGPGDETVGVNLPIFVCAERYSIRCAIAWSLESTQHVNHVPTILH